MQRTQSTLFAAICLALAMTAGAEGPYVNHPYGFGFTPPPGWEEVKHPDALTVYREPGGLRPVAPRPGRESNEAFLARTKATLRAPARPEMLLRGNITVTARSVGSRSLEQCARESRARAAGMRTYRILGEQSRKLGGVPALEHTIRISRPGESTLRLREVFCVRKGRLLSLTLAAPQARFARYSVEFDKVLASFVWQR